MMSLSRFFSSPGFFDDRVGSGCTEGLTPETFAPTFLSLSGGSTTYRTKRHEQLPCRPYSLWRILAGYVRTYTLTESGGFVPLGFWSSGDIFGSAIAQAYPYCIECLTAVEAEQVGPAYSTHLAAIRAQAVQYGDLLRIAHCRQTELRLLQFICWLSLHFGSATVSGRKIHIRLSHQEIAETIGSSRVTVTRLLKKLGDAEDISWTTRIREVHHSAFEKTAIVSGASARSLLVP